jgi:hypothetical protein
MSLKKARPLVDEWLAGDDAKRTSVVQSLKGSKAMLDFLQCLGEVVPQKK